VPEEPEEEELDYENFEINQNVVMDFLIFWMDSVEQRKLKLGKCACIKF
jgi:hypothetical protein